MIYNLRSTILIIISLISSLTFLALAPLSGVRAADFFISPTGNDTYSGTSTTQPLASFNKAWEKLNPGDTLYLMDGTYYQTLSPSLGGAINTAINTQDYQTYPLDHPLRVKNYLTIKALNDGQAIIDGQYQRPPVQLDHEYIILEGIVAKNSSDMVYFLRSHNLIIRRCSGYNANPKENSHVFTAYAGGSPQDPANILIEDSVAGGSGRKMFMAYATYVNVIFRRLFAAWQEWTSDPGASYHPGEWPWGDGIEIYNWQQPDLTNYPGLVNSIVENSIVYGMLSNYGFSLSPNPARTQFNNFLGDMAIAIGQKWNRTASMTWPLCADPDGIDQSGNYLRPWPTWSDGSLGPKCNNWIGWYPHRAGFDFGVYEKPFYRHNTFRDLFATGNAMAGLVAGFQGVGWCNGTEGNNHYPCSKCNSVEVSPSDNCSPGVYTNSERSADNILDHLTLANNGIGTPVSNEGAGVEVNNYTLSMFDNFGSKSNLYLEGNSGYADKSKGARLRYRYINGTLTTQELWPWPMEDRIRSEFNTHLQPYHGVNSELQNFSVTNTIVPLINQYTAVPVPLSSSNPFDLDSNSVIDYRDLLLFLPRFNPLGSFTLFDFNSLIKYFGTSL
jgi:hypothetical protein